MKTNRREFLVHSGRLATTGLDLASVAPPLAGKVDASGDLQLIGFTDFTWKGAVTATRIAWPSGGAARIATPITVAKDGQTISWDAPSAVIDSGRVDALRSLRPARYAAATRGDFNLKTQTVELYQATLRGSPGDVSARGTYGVRDGRMNFQGTARFARLADVAPLTGSARSLWSVSQASKSAPIRITADAQGRNVTSSIAALQQLAGPEPRVKLSAVVRGGRFVIESGNVTGAGVRANMTGRVADSGAITARAEGALTRTLDLGGASLGAMDFTADITGNTNAPIVALRLADGEVTAAGVTIDNLGGQANARLGEAIAGDFSLRGASGAKAFIASGRIQGGEGDFRIINLVASLGDLRLTAPRLAYSDGALSATFDASGPLAGIAGIDRGTLTAKGNVSIGEDLNVDVTGQLANVRSGVGAVIVGHAGSPPACASTCNRPSSSTPCCARSNDAIRAPNRATRSVVAHGPVQPASAAPPPALPPADPFPPPAPRRKRGSETPAQAAAPAPAAAKRRAPRRRVAATAEA